MARRKIEVLVVGNADSLKRALGQSGAAVSKFGKQASTSEKFSRSLGRGMMVVGKSAAVAGAALGGGLLVGAKKSLEAFAESEKVMAQTNAVLKSTGTAANVTAKDVTKLAGSLSAKTGIDDEAIQSGQNLLLTFTKIRNETGKGNKIFNQATRAATDMSVAMGKDLNSSVLMVGKALNDPLKGVTALGRAGVQFTEQQREQIKALVESGQAMRAQKLILAELQTQFGGSAKAAGETTAGAFNKLKVAVGNAQEAIGGALAPTVARGAEALAKFVREIQNGTGAGGRFRDGVVKAFNDVRAVVVPAVTTVFNVIRRAVGVFTDIAGAVVRSKTALVAFGAAASLLVAKFAFDKLKAGIQGVTTALSGMSKAERFSAILAVVGLVASALSGFANRSKQAEQATRDLTDAIDRQRDALKRVRDLDLDAAEAKNRARASALAVKEAQRQLTAAIRQYGRGSLEAKRAQNDLNAAQIQAKRDTRALADVQHDAAGAMRDAERATEDVRAAQFNATSTTQGWTDAVRDLNAQLGAIGGVADGAAAALRRLAEEQARTKGRSVNAGAVLFPDDAAISEEQALRDSTAAGFDAAATARQRAKLKTLAGRSLTSTKGLKGDELSDAKSRNASIRQARAELREFNRAAREARALAKIDVRIAGLEKTKRFNDAVRSIAASVKDKLTSAVASFREQWEATTGGAFDKTTADLIAGGEKAQALAAALAADQKIAREQEDAANQRALEAALAEGDEQAIADARAVIARTERERDITRLQDEAEAERARIELERATERQAQLDRETAAFEKSLSDRLNAEVAQLQERKQNYAQFVADLNSILAPAGMAFDASADDEQSINAGPASGGRPGRTRSRGRTVTPQTADGPLVLMQGVTISGQADAVRLAREMAWRAGF